ncbi:MAG: hypothetical protein SFY32_15220 [Bacteroidota bacterium]|nr:hypothetical protein [Bacteroidota bacterium]
MARQGGILKIKGTVGGLTFYKSQDGDLVREKGGVSGERIANDPAFARTRENGAEFGEAAIAGKNLRDALRNLMLNASDNRVTSRLTAVMSSIKNYDITSSRGERTVANGMPTGMIELKGFDFNVSAPLGSILFKPYTIDPINGSISIQNLNPVNDVDYPVGATHMTISGGVAIVDFSTGDKELSLYNPVNLTISNITGNVFLGLSGPLPPAIGNKFYLLKVEFSQMVNGQQYSLKNGAYNALTIVEIV